MRVRSPRVIIGATSTASGKTSLVCGLARALTSAGLAVACAKCGPDYLDGALHEMASGRPSVNLDLFLGSERLAASLLARRAQGCDLTLVEGVMGYFDGLATSDEASTWAVAHATQSPAILVVDGRRKSLSLAADLLGYTRLRTPSHVCAVIVNRVSERRYAQLRTVVEDECGIRCLGYVPECDEARIAHRHLGLVTTPTPELMERMDGLGAKLSRTLDLDAILALAADSQDLEVEDPTPLPDTACGPVIAVARDEAFSFCYGETLEQLTHLGARIAFFSPLEDSAMPVGTSGLYLPGGYPELHARKLSENVSMRAAIRASIALGLPTIAECGGYLYLARTLEDAEGVAWPMAGALACHARRGDRLAPFGYVTLTAREDSLLARAGQSLRAHEFHYWRCDGHEDAFLARKPHTDVSWDSGIATRSLYAGFGHLYLPGAPEAARRFVDACADFGRSGKDRV